MFLRVNLLSPAIPNYTSQTELSLPLDLEISQVGMTVDNTIKTRFIFEINKGSNKNIKIDEFLILTNTVEFQWIKLFILRMVK